MKPVEFLDGTTEAYAFTAEVVFAGSSENRVTVNLTRSLRMIRVGTEEFILTQCKHQERIARLDDECTWPVKREGYIFLVPFPVTNEIAERRKDFREVPSGAGTVEIEF